MLVYFRWVTCNQTHSNLTKSFLQISTNSSSLSGIHPAFTSQCTLLWQQVDDNLWPMLPVCRYQLLVDCRLLPSLFESLKYNKVTLFRSNPCGSTISRMVSLSPSLQHVSLACFELILDSARSWRGNKIILLPMCMFTVHWNLTWVDVCFFVGCEVCERVAFYAISSNLVIYLTTVLHEDVSTSAKNVNNWGGTTFMTPLIGAFVADAYLGRYWTISLFSCGYFLVRLSSSHRIWSFFML